MHRPVMSREIGFLVQGLVKLSEWLNHQSGLDQPAQEGEMAETQIQVCLWLELSDIRVTLVCELGLSSISILCTGNLNVPLIPAQHLEGNASNSSLQ